MLALPAPDLRRSAPKFGDAAIEYMSVVSLKEKKTNEL